MNLLLTLLNLLFLVGMSSLAICLWRGKTAWQALFALAFAAWCVGALSVSLALRNHPATWLSQVRREFRFASRMAHGAEDHHKLISPAPEERLPPEIEALQEPLRLEFRFQLAPSGQVSEVECRTPNASLIHIKSLQEALLRWRFGALPADSLQSENETVTVTLTNRHAAMPSFGEVALFALVFGSVWLLCVWLTPWDSESASLGRRMGAAPDSLKRLTLSMGFLMGLGWLMLMRLAIGSAKFALVAKLPLWMAIASTLYLLTLFWANRSQSIPRLFALHCGKWWVGMGVALLLITRFTSLGVSHDSNHIKLWLRLPRPFQFIEFQTIELVKAMMLCFVACVAYEKSRSGRSERNIRNEPVIRLSHALERYQGVIGAFGLALLALFLMKDFGPALLLFLLLLTLFWIQGYPQWAGVGFLALVGAMSVANQLGVPSNWHTRVAIWRQPWEMAASPDLAVAQAGEHAIRALWAVSAGGWSGAGLGRGMPESVPEAFSDFMFTSLAEEIGWIGCAAVIALLLYISVTLLGFAKQREDAASKSFIAGVGALLILQAALIVGGNIGFCPLTGITLPFLSHGGASLILTCLGLGMAVGLSTREEPLSEDFLGETALSSKISIERLQRFAFPALALALAGRLAYLQMGGVRRQIMEQSLVRADSTVARNPRLEVVAEPENMTVRGRILDASGGVISETRGSRRVVASPALYASVTGFWEAGGATGIERYLGDAMRGTLRIGDSIVANSADGVGYDVILSLEPRLQAKAYALLERGHFSGAIVGVNPKNGAIRFAVSRSETTEPPKNRAEWRKGYDDPKQAAGFWYRKRYAPGSVFKMLVATCALESLPDAETLRFQCTGEHTPAGGFAIADFERRKDSDFAGHRAIGLEEGLKVSCNFTYAQMGERLGWDRLYQSAENAGFHTHFPLFPETLRGRSKDWLEAEPSQITPQGALPQNLPRSENAPVFLAQTALGERNVRMTPLHLAAWAAGIANEGKMMEPTLALRIADRRGKTLWDSAPRLLRQVCKPETARRLKGMLQGVVEQGTGKRARVSGLVVAGKTGSPMSHGSDTNALFVGFASSDSETLAIAVVAEGGATGGTVAAPLAAEMFRTAFGVRDTR